MTARIVILGGGITGLAAAFAIKERSEADGLAVRCTVLEASPQWGGKIETHREAGFILEGGPDSLLARKPAGLQLIRRLGLEAEVVPMDPGAHRTWIVRGGKLVPMPHGTSMGIPVDIPAFLRNQLISARGKARALMDLCLPAPGRAEPEANDEALGALLRRRFGDEMVDWLFEPLLAGIYAGAIDELSLLATFPQLARYETEHGSLIRGAAAERQRQLRDVPAAAAHPASGRSAFVTLRSGLRTLVERLYDVLYEWADLQPGTRAQSLVRAADGSYRIRTERGEIVADAVLVTTPAGAAAPLLSALTPTAQRLARIRYVSTATVALAYPADQVRLPAHGSGFLVPRAEGAYISACTFVSSKWPHTTPAGYVVLRCYVGRAGQEEGLADSDAAMVRRVREDLERLLGVTAWPWFHRVVRWPHAMPQYAVGHRRLVAEVEQDLARTAPGVFLAGGGYHGVGIPDCIAAGERAAQAILSHLAARQV
ncbi:protoporphyrinogen oxidase [Alicyclobacillus cellulosilyticus]|uniref:Coproporphyrinogen III oxidase n=1 Tax=Alicyclobacillus cellulosilyticus TaxID=1003997 RepID=A0A917NJP0_9BACL|nr:protoporphyrinogen oxidase [Alicyclobacillus cellulosilyticus]GGJ05937.1 protoporphyrinogen oxidase [Alicyclobacillus cellulosilyticus]